MSTLAELLLEGHKIARRDDGYVTSKGDVHISDIVDGADQEPTRLYLDQQLTAQEVHLLLMGIFYPNIDPSSYQISTIQSPITNRAETVVVFQRTPVILTQPAA